MQWTTVKDNAMTLVFPSGGADVLRIVFDPQGSDIAYVVPLGPDKGNGNAKLIAASPVLLNACRFLLETLDAYGSGIPSHALDAAKHCRDLCTELEQITAASR